MKFIPHDYQEYATRFVMEHPYCGLILDIAAGIEEECGDFMEKGRYEDQWKAGLIRRHVSMEFLLPVNPEVWDTLTRRICKLLKVPYQKNRTEAK